MSEYEIDHLRDDDPVNDFQSREPVIKEFLSRDALSHERNGFGRTYVARTNVEGGSVPRLAGFYTIAMARVHVRELPSELQRSVPAFPVPVALLGQLGRDMRSPLDWRLGEALLRDALERIIEISDRIGCSGVILDALNEKLVEYYQRFSFIALPRSGFPRKMFLPIKDARAARDA